MTTPDIANLRRRLGIRATPPTDPVFQPVPPQPVPPDPPPPPPSEPSLRSRFSRWGNTAVAVIGVLALVSFVLRAVIIDPGTFGWRMMYDQSVRSFDIQVPTSVTSAQISAVAVSPDGRTLLTGSSNYEVRFWNLKTGALLHKRDSDWPRAAAFSPDGSLALTGGTSHDLTLWDVPTASVIRTLTGSAENIRTITFRSTKRFALSAGDDKILRLWDTETGTMLDYPAQPDAIIAVRFLPDASYAVSVGDDGTVVRRKLYGSDDPTTFRLPPEYGGLSTLSPDGRFLLSHARRGLLSLWDTQTNTMLRVVPGPAGYLPALAVSADGNEALLADEQHNVFLWDLHNGVARASFTGHFKRITSLAFVPGERLAVSGSADRSAKLWALPP